MGIREAAAEWVTFLDSDDALEPDAVHKLLEAAVTDRADVVFGQTARLFLEEGRIGGWRRYLYEERRHLHSIDEYPDLVMDSTATGKLYRRQFLLENDIRFIEYRSYEDMLFSAEVCTKATSISVIPDRVYVWKVHDTSVRRSITNQRAEESNLLHRLEILERIDDVVEESGSDQLKARFELKFLQHDARLYLTDMEDFPPAYAQRVLELLGPRLRSIPKSVYAELPVAQRLLYGAALMGSVEGVVESIPAFNGRLMPEGKTVEIEGRVLWLPASLSSSPPALDSLAWALLDITDDSMMGAPVDEIRYVHHATAIEVLDARRAVVTGHTADPFRRFLDNFELSSGHVLVRLNTTNEVATLPLSIERGVGRVEWSFGFEIPTGMPLVWPLRLTFWIEARQGDAVNTLPVVNDVPEDAMMLRVRHATLRAFLRQSFQFYTTRHGRLGLKQLRTRGRRGKLEERLARWQGSRPA